MNGRQLKQPVLLTICFHGIYTLLFSLVVTLHFVITCLLEEKGLSVFRSLLRFELEDRAVLRLRGNSAER
jgi:hypothetical protein